VPQRNLPPPRPHPCGVRSSRGGHVEWFGRLCRKCIPKPKPGRRMGFAAARRGCRKQMCLASRSSELQATPTLIAERGRRDAVRLRAERLPLAAVEGHARRQRSAAITAMDWQGLGTVIARKSRSVFTAARRCHDEISIPLPAFGTAQQPRPIDIVIAEPCCAAWVAMSARPVIAFLHCAILTLRSSQAHKLAAMLMSASLPACRSG
jgi:hypothetical protein